MATRFGSSYFHTELVLLCAAVIACVSGSSIVMTFPVIAVMTRRNSIL